MLHVRPHVDHYYWQNFIARDVAWVFLDFARRRAAECFEKSTSMAICVYMLIICMICRDITVTMIVLHRCKVIDVCIILIGTWMRNLSGIRVCEASKTSNNCVLRCLAYCRVFHFYAIYRRVCIATNIVSRGTGKTSHSRRITFQCGKQSNGSARHGGAVEISTHIIIDRWFM